MAENLLEAGPPSAKRPKMTAPASDGPGNASSTNSNNTHKEKLTPAFSPASHSVLHIKPDQSVRNELRALCLVLNRCKSPVFTLHSAPG